MPQGAIYVGRPTPYGNPWKADDPHWEHGWPMSQGEVVYLYQWWITEISPRLDCFRPLAMRRAILLRHVDLLTGHDLACWCLDQPCHADVLLKVANR